AAKDFVPKAKLQAATAAAVAACDTLDGVKDGVIDDPARCPFDPKALVGTKVGDDTFTEADADVVRKIWEGPRGQDGTFLWHGLADQLIPAQGTIDYFKRVQQQMGGAEKTSQFARLFLAPGVDHGFRGAGPTPTGQMEAIIRWVEQGQAPDKLIAERRDSSGKVIC